MNLEQMIGSALTPELSLSLVAAEVAILVSLLLVATFVESIFAKKQSEQTAPSLSLLAEEQWVRTLAAYLLICSLVCVVAVGVALLFLFLGGRRLEIATVATFGCVITSFVVVTSSLLNRMRGRNRE
jgi:hypothetical protein